MWIADQWHTDIEVYFNFSNVYMILKTMEGIGYNKYQKMEKTTVSNHILNTNHCLKEMVDTQPDVQTSYTYKIQW